MTRSAATSESNLKAGVDLPHCGVTLPSRSEWKRFMKKIISAESGLCSAISANAQQFSTEVRRADLRRPSLRCLWRSGLPS